VERAAAVAWETEGIDEVAKALQNGLPSARVIRSRPLSALLYQDF
jgi:hypothetical protein